jgi:hypothetical protein
MLIRGVVDDELGDHLDVASVRGLHEGLEILDAPVGRIDRFVLADVVAVVSERRGIERQDPDARDAQRLDIVELLDQTAEVTEAVGISVPKALDVDLVDDSVLVPERVDELAGCLVGGFGHQAFRSIAKT